MSGLDHYTVNSSMSSSSVIIFFTSLAPIRYGKMIFIGMRAIFVPGSCRCLTRYNEENVVSNKSDVLGGVYTSTVPYQSSVVKRLVDGLGSLFIVLRDDLG